MLEPDGAVQSPDTGARTLLMFLDTTACLSAVFCFRFGASFMCGRETKVGSILSIVDSRLVSYTFGVLLCQFRHTVDCVFLTTFRE